MVGSGRSKVRRVAQRHRPDGTRERPKIVQASIHAPGRRGRRAGRPLDAQRLFTKVKAIADTGFLVAFGDRRDLHHAWALQIAQRVTEPLLTWEAVLAGA